MPTHCGKGRRLDEANTYRDRTGKWHCRTCSRENTRLWRERRRAEQPPPERSYAVPSGTELSWAAGLFEGEGTATISGAGRHTRGRLAVTSTEPEIVGFFRERFGGRLRSVGRRSPNAREAFEWLVSGSQAALVAGDLLPFVRTRRTQERLTILVESQALRRRGSRDPDYAAALAPYVERVRALNRRGGQELPAGRALPAPESGNSGGMAPDR